MTELIELVKSFKEPALMVAVLALIAEGVVILKLFKILERRDGVIETLATEVKDGNVTMAKVATLLEVLVNGRRSA